MSGGGGVSGAVSYPDHVEATHQLMLAGDTGTPAAGDWGSAIDLFSILDTLQNNDSPYYNKEAFNPSGMMGMAQIKLNDLETAIDAIDEETTYESLMDKAISEVEDLMSSDYIDDAVETYERDTRLQHLQNASRLAGSYAEINAINGSAFIIGMSLLESQRQADVNKQRILLEGEFEAKRWQMVDQAVGRMTQIISMRLETLQSLGTMQIEVGRFSSILKGEEDERNVEYEREDALWDLKALTQGANILASPGGGVALPEKPSKLASGASGALSGAIAGAKAAAIIPGVGPLLGAGVGALLGATAGAA